MKTIKDYIQGERFVYGKKNCMVLEHMDDGTLCMVLDEDFESKFGETNNFAESELRKKLNGEYLDEWVKDGVDRASFVLMQVDLTVNDGLKDYGTCECLLAPRTCDQHRKYRNLIPNSKNTWEWTATAYSTKANGCSITAYQVSGAGGLSFGITVFGAVGVRPLFKLNPDAIIVPESNDTETLKIKVDKLENMLHDSFQGHLLNALRDLEKKYAKKEKAYIAERTAKEELQKKCDAMTVQQGHWVYDPNATDWGLGGWICNLCGHRNDNLPNNQPDSNPYIYAGSQYCPACGAKMVKEQES